MIVESARSTPAGPGPILVAHRGASGYAPEHTLEAYRLAIEQGADFIEPDLVMTRDGVLVARHENEIGGTTDVAQHPRFADRRTTKLVDGVPVEGWFVEDFTLEELKTLRARERIPQLRPENAWLDGRFEIPTLEEILALVQEMQAVRVAAGDARPIGIYPETKHPSHFAALGLPMEEALLETLGRWGYTDAAAPVYIQSFETANLRRLREQTSIRLMQLIDASGAPFDCRARGEARTYADMTTDRGLDEIAAYADAVGPHKSLVIPVAEGGRLGTPTGLVERAHARGLEVHAWTFRAENEFLPPALRWGADRAAHGDLAAEIAAYFDAGVDGIFVDHPDRAVWAREVWRRHGARAPLP
ncbi:MAG: glycerophosphodiester phosphodiesterase [Pseudomonadota bacterium]|jgi:Glycerophosphoryl diester phosphodiesterase|nr:MAG: glycerophosphodiester phosphodiesterase [Pseudomonadota bacterium]